MAFEGKYLKFYADTPTERNKLFCFKMFDEDYTFMLYRFMYRGLRFRAAYIEDKSSFPTINEKLNVLNIQQYFDDNLKHNQQMKMMVNNKDNQNKT